MLSKTAPFKRGPGRPRLIKDVSPETVPSDFLDTPTPKTLKTTVQTTEKRPRGRPRLIKPSIAHVSDFSEDEEVYDQHNKRKISTIKATPTQKRPRGRPRVVKPGDVQCAENFVIRVSNNLSEDEEAYDRINARTISEKIFHGSCTLENNKQFDLFSYPVQLLDGFPLSLLSKQMDLDIADAYLDVQLVDDEEGYMTITPSSIQLCGDISEIVQPCS